LYELVIKTIIFTGKDPNILRPILAGGIQIMMSKKAKPGKNYFVINTDELYAEKIYDVLKKGQMAKGKWPEGDISFEEWKKKTFKS
jgi:hypothetical protein